MKISLNLIGAAFCLIGIIWILQGTGALPYGDMADKIQWAFLGQSLETLGVGVLVVANLRTNPGTGGLS